MIRRKFVLLLSNSRTMKRNRTSTKHRIDTMVLGVFVFDYCEELNRC
jgi:hypothetical protein